MLLALLLAVLLACAPAVQAPPDPAFVPVASPAGPAWAWAEDPALQVAVADDDAGEWTRGLYVRYGDTLVATRSARPWLGSEGWMPLVLALPDVEEPLVDASDELVLAMTGSSEHGCEADDLAVRVSPRRTGAGVSVTLEVEGIFYFAFPGDASVEVEHADGALVLPPRTLDDGESVEVEDVSGLSLGGLTPAPIRVDLRPALPWFQVADDGDFLEGDMDHSCEIAGADFRPRATVEMEL